MDERLFKFYIDKDRVIRTDVDDQVVVFDELLTPYIDKTVEITIREARPTLTRLYAIAWRWKDSVGRPMPMDQLESGIGSFSYTSYADVNKAIADAKRDAPWLDFSIVGTSVVLPRKWLAKAVSNESGMSSS